MSFDEIADVYDETRTISDATLREFYQVVKRKGVKIDQDTVVLDIGVGTGRTVEPLLACGAQLIGIDISRNMLLKMVEKVKERGGDGQVSPVLCDGAKLPFQAGSFDVAISIHVLHLVKNWKELLEDTKRVLKRDGFLVLADDIARELVSAIGQKYLELRRIYHVPRQYWKRVLKEVLVTVRAHTLLDYLEKMQDDDWENYLKKNSRSMETFAITWKEKVKVSQMFDHWNRRLVSAQWKLTEAAHEKIMLELKNWKTKQFESKDALEELTRNFRISVVRF